MPSRASLLQLACKQRPPLLPLPPSALDPITVSQYKHLRRLARNFDRKAGYKGLISDLYRQQEETESATYSLWITNFLRGADFYFPGKPYGSKGGGEEGKQREKEKEMMSIHDAIACSAEILAEGNLSRFVRLILRDGYSLQGAEARLEVEEAAFSMIKHLGRTEKMQSLLPLEDKILDPEGGVAEILARKAPLLDITKPKEKEKEPEEADKPVKEALGSSPEKGADDSVISYYASPLWSSPTPPGTLLLAHPLAHGIWNRSVILLTSQGSRGTNGLILNRDVSQKELGKGSPIHSYMLSMLRNLRTADKPSKKSEGTEDSKEEGLPSALKRPESYRGRTAPPHLTLTLGRSLTSGAIPGCFGGPIPGADIVHSCMQGGRQDLIPERPGVKLYSGWKPGAKGKVEAQAYFGSASWSPGQLQRELALGYWLPLHLRDDSFLRKVVQAPGGGDQLWKHLLTLAGKGKGGGWEVEELAELACLPSQSGKVALNREEERGERDGEDWDFVEVQESDY